MDLGAHNKDVFGALAGEYSDRMRSPVAFLNVAEQQALMTAAARGRDVAILDIGVGAGRTTPLLRLISDDYTAVDYAPEMVEALTRHFPDVTARVADARALSQFPDRGFGLVVFSDHGLDTLAHEDRVTALKELRRVVTDEGTLVFSTLNRGGKSFDETPFQLKRPTTRWRFTPFETAVRWLFYVLRPGRVVRGVSNWRHGHALRQDHGDWAMGPLKAHDFAPFVHFTTTRDLAAALRASAWEPITVLTEDGDEVDLTAPTSTADAFTVVARPAPARAGDDVQR